VGDALWAREDCHSCRGKLASGFRRVLGVGCPRQRIPGGGGLHPESNMAYSRSNPSPRYRELVALYSRMHAEGEHSLGIPPERTFHGMSLTPQASRIRSLIRRTCALSILDYGSGKGQQYVAHCVDIPGHGVQSNVQDYWDVDYVLCYDPGYPPYSKLPEGRFDGVIATDVLEHCPQEDLAWIVAEMFSFAEKFVFASIACYQARKRLPNGENAHCTIMPLHWWRALFEQASARHSSIVWEAWLQYATDSDGGSRITEERIGSAGDAS
jgi:hypothetical protein